MNGVVRDEGHGAPVALADERVGAWQAAHRSCLTPCHRSFLIIDPGEDRKDLAEAAEEGDEEAMEEIEGRTHRSY